MFSTSAALLFGLGTRIALDKFFGNGSNDPNAPDSIGDIILLGVVQGVALYFTLMEFRDFAFVVAFAIAARLVIEFMMIQDMTKSATTLLGVALGVLVTDVLSQLIEDGHLYSVTTTRSTAGTGSESEYCEEDTVLDIRRRKRLVKFSSATEYSAVGPSKPVRPPKQDPARKWRTESSVQPSITSSTEDMVDPQRVMDPLEREVAALRARASLADSERRRFKEEKKWAVSQGNLARAAQMSWQVKRYTALTQSFTKEADARFLEGLLIVNTVAAIKAARQQAQNEAPLPTIQRADRLMAEGHTNHARDAHSSSRQFFVERDTTVNVETTTSRQRRPSSVSAGNLKSAMRVTAR
ncbi:hypothetical protein JVU11DRAFT_2441 [Chiua virens]|nr:hypothetical protein JVU11DRAFT_2441 [Chiua virens]